MLTPIKVFRLSIKLWFKAPTTAESASVRGSGQEGTGQAELPHALRGNVDAFAHGNAETNGRN